MTSETSASGGNHCNLRLYVAGQTARTQAAINNLARICREHLEGPLQRRSDRPARDLETVNALASRLVVTIRSLELGDIVELGSHLTVSVGGSQIAPGIDVMRATDGALYEAKRQGRNRAVVIGASPSAPST